MEQTYHAFADLPPLEETRDAVGHLPADSRSGGSPIPAHTEEVKTQIKEYVTGCFGKRPIWHPTNKMHIAFTCAKYLRDFEHWRAEHHLHLRPEQLFEINGAFAERYLDATRDCDWKNEIYTLRSTFTHLWNKYCDLLEEEVKKPQTKRICAITEDRKPVMDDEYKAFLLVAEEFADPLMESEKKYAAYDMLAFRGLVPDFSGVRELDWAEAYERGFHRNAFALRDDGKLLPPEFVEYVLERNRREGLPAELDGETYRWMKEFHAIDAAFPRNAKGSAGRRNERTPVYYQPSLHAFERVKPHEMLDAEQAQKALSGRLEDSNAQALYAIGLPAEYLYFSLEHHPTNPYHFAWWHVHQFKVDYGKLLYRGPEIERTAGLGLICDEFIAWYFKMMDACRWSEEDGSPIADPQTHVLNAFDWWRRKYGKDLLGADGFPVEQGQYGECLWAAWQTSPWDVAANCARPNLRPAAFDNLAVRGIVPYFPAKLQSTICRRLKTPEDECRAEVTAGSCATPDAKKDTNPFNLGFPLPYADFTPDHHPTSAMHLAYWLTSFSEHIDVWGEGIRYRGPYVKRSDELGKLHWEFIRHYMRKMDAQGWKNDDGSRIADALKHILDSFEDWRTGELAKPKEERACEFGEDGFPKDKGTYADFLEVAWTFFDGYYTDSGIVDFGSGDALFNELESRGLIFGHLEQSEMSESTPSKGKEGK